MQIKFSDAHMAAQVFCNAIMDNRAMGVEGSNLGLLKKSHKLAGMTVEQKESAVASMILKLRSNANPMNVWFLRQANNTEVTPQALEDIKTNDVNLFNDLMQTLANDVPKEERLKLALAIFTKGFVFFKNQAELNVAFEEAQEAFTTMHPTEAQVRTANEFWKQLVGSAERFATNELYYPSWDGPIENETERFGMIDNTFDQVLNQVKGINERFMADQERLARAQSAVSLSASRNLVPAAQAVVESVGELVQHAVNEPTPEPTLEPIKEEAQEPTQTVQTAQPATPKQSKSYSKECTLYRYHGATFGIEYHHTTKLAKRDYETKIEADIELADNPVEMNVPEVSDSSADLRKFVAGLQPIAKEAELSDEELFNSLQNDDGGESLAGDDPSSYVSLLAESEADLTAYGVDVADTEGSDEAPTLPATLAKVDIRPSSVMKVIGQIGAVAAFKAAKSASDAIAPLSIPATPKPAAQVVNVPAAPAPVEFDDDDDDEKEDLSTGEIPYWVKESEQAIAARSVPVSAPAPLPAALVQTAPPVVPKVLPPLRNIGATGRVTSSRVHAMQDVAEIKKAQQAKQLSLEEKAKRVKLNNPIVHRVRMAGE